MSQQPPSSMLGFLHLPQLVQVVVLFAAFGAFAYCIEDQQYIGAGVIAGLFVFYFAARSRYRRYHRQASENTMSRRDYLRRRSARRDVDGEAPDD